MEPADLTPRSKTEDSLLDALLQQPLPPVPDDGFSRRVMAALPPAHPATRAASRQVFVVVGAVAGLAIAIVRMESIAAFQSEWTSAKVALAQTAATLGDPNALIALSIAGVSLLYAFVSAAPRRR